MNKRKGYQKNPGRSTDQAILPLGKKEDLTTEGPKEKKVLRFEEIKEDDEYKGKRSLVSFDENEDQKLGVTKGEETVRTVEGVKEGKYEEKKQKLKLSKDTSVQDKRKRLMEIKKKKRASVRWQPTNQFVFDDLSLGGAKMISQTKIGRLRSAIPGRDLQAEDSSSDVSDPEIRRLKRKAGVCCKYMIECLFVIGIFASSTINFNFLSLLYFLGGLLLFSERMSLSIKGGNSRQDTLISMFMFCIPLSLVFKVISLVIIYSNLSKFEALVSVKEYIENDVLFETFQHIAKYMGVVQSAHSTFINIILTVAPEILIGGFIIALNYVSSDKIGEEYMNKQDVLQEKSLALGSSSLAVLLIGSIEFLAVINVSWIGLIFQLFVLITVLSFSCKKSNILFVVDLISLISIFVSVGQLILLFLFEIPLLPCNQLSSIFNFIGVDQDRSQLMAIIHATGAIAVFVFGIVYLRSRRLFIIMSMYEHQYECEDREEAYQEIGFKMDKENNKNQNNSNLFPINEEENESSNEDEQEPEVNDYLIWRIYDKIIDAFTSEFVVSNLLRLSLCFWILRYNCLQSIVIVIFLFHSTLIKSYINFLPFIQFIYLPYMMLNLVGFYIINLIVKVPINESHSLSGIKYGIIIFENPAIEFPIMLFCILLSSLFAIKISNFSEMLQGKDESSFQKHKTMKTLRNIQKQSTFLSMIYYIFYLSIEALLLFILLLNVVSKVNLTNFCLNLYLVVYLIYPDIARRHIQKFLFIIEALNLVNYVYGIIIASSEKTFSVGEVGNLIGIDSYDVYVRKYFNVIPTIRIVALIIVTMTIWNTLPNDADEEYQSDKSAFEAKLYKTLYGFSKWFTEVIYICINVIRNLVIWICYILILLILIQNDHSVKNWILAILIMFIIYKHCSRSEFYMNYLATYAGFVFISTWVYQFLKFEVIKEAFGVTNVENIPFNGELWGYTVLTEEQLLFRVVALSALLVISVVGTRSVSSKETIVPNFLDPNMLQEIQTIEEDTLYNYLLKQKETIFWSSTSLFWPAITFLATFFNIILTFALVCFSLYWKLSWIMAAYLFFTVGPWFGFDLNYLQTFNLGKEKPLTYFSSKAMREQRLRKWKVLMWITIIAWVVIFPSERVFRILDISIQPRVIFYGEWLGILYPNTTPQVTFWQHVSGYMGILLLLVFERKFLEWLDGEEIREEQKHFEATIGGINNQKNYEFLSREVDRRKRIEDRKLGRYTGNGKKIVGFAGVEEEIEVDPKEELKRQIDQAYSILGKENETEKEKEKKIKEKVEEIKTKPLKSALKSAMKGSKLNKENEVKLEDSKDKAAYSSDPTKFIKEVGNESDEEFNILFTK